jgi:hypothetical protein
MTQALISGFQDNYFITANKGKTLYLFAALYASFIVFFPWEVINRQGESVGGFNDFEVYLNHFSVNTASKVEVYGYTTLLHFFTGEVIWDYFVAGLSDYIGPYAALRTTSFIIAFVWALIAFRSIPIFWAIIFLTNPTSIDIAMSSMRNGLAYAVFLFGLIYLSGMKRTFTIFISPFIHSTSAALLIFYYARKIWVKKITKTSVVFFSEKKRAIMIAILPGIVIGLALTSLDDVILNFLGDRRVGRIDVSEAPSILQSLFWYILFAVQLTCSTNYIKKHALTINVISWYLIMNLYISWSSRIWGAMIPLIAIAIWDLPLKKRKWIILLWLAYLFLWYVYWTKILLWISG